MASNAERVRALQASGWTQQQIATAIGRSPSYVSRVARGLTPGRLVGPNLRALQAGLGASVPPAPRRTRASGETARVRGGAPRAGAAAARPGRPHHGTLPDGREWRLIGWSDRAGEWTHLFDAPAPTRGPVNIGGPPASLHDTARVTVYVEKKGGRGGGHGGPGGYSTWVYPWPDDWELPDLIALIDETY